MYERRMVWGWFDETNGWNRIRIRRRSEHCNSIYNPFQEEISGTIVFVLIFGTISMAGD